MFEELLEKVGGFRHYYTLKEMRAHTARLKRNKNFKIKIIGKSQEGYPIELIRYDSGHNKNLLLWGFEDPTEPVCSLTMTWILDQLADKKSPLHKIKCNWGIIKCINPDEAKKNEYWFKKPGDLRAFLNGSWEPKNPRFWNSPPDCPEANTLKKAIAMLKPHILYDMHDESHFPGHYFLLASYPIKIKDMQSHFKYAKSLDMPLKDEPILDASFIKNSNWAFYSAFKHNPKCVVVGNEVCGYKIQSETKLERILNKYANLLELVSCKNKNMVSDALRLIKDAKEHEPMGLKELSVSGCGFRVLRKHGYKKQTDELEQLVWKYLKNKLNERKIEPIPLDNQVKVQLHFLFTIMMQNGIQWQK